MISFIIPPQNNWLHISLMELVFCISVVFLNQHFLLFFFSSHSVLIQYENLKRNLKIWKVTHVVCLSYGGWHGRRHILQHLPKNILLCPVFTEAMFPSLSPGIAGFFFLLCNTALILNVQVLYKEDLSPGTAIGKTPEMMRVKQTQDHISSVKTPSVDSFSTFSASFWYFTCSLGCTQNICQWKQLKLLKLLSVFRAFT